MSTIDDAVKMSFGKLTQQIVYVDEGKRRCSVVCS